MFWRLFLWPRKSRFPATETVVARDSVRMGSYCAGSPSIGCWRDHSAGRSARRVTPMPCGSRPSMAALTRSGARKASEMVMLTLRTLHRLALRDALRIRRGVGDEFVEPTAASRDRCDQECAGLGPDRAGVLRRHRTRARESHGVAFEWRLVPRHIQRCCRASRRLASFLRWPARSAADPTGPRRARRGC